MNILKVFRKNKKCNLLIMILLFFSTNCSLIPNDEALVNKVLFKTAKILKKTKHLELIGFGGGTDINDLHQEVSLTFRSHEKVNVEKARELLVFCSEVLLNKINSTENIKKYLLNGKFTTKSIKVCVIFEDENLEYYSTEYLSMCFCSHSNIYFLTFEKYKNVLDYKETYEESVQILKDQGKYDQIMKEVHEVCNKY
ncbi:MAG: hypothetical protein JXA99_11805 [Candidatus Lokiarchaeota archaeon]|nr:hypothetical protein [Candidatus Lokiarchaeota archaeon]